MYTRCFVSCKNLLAFLKLTPLTFDRRELVKKVVKENDCGASLDGCLYSRCSLYKFFQMIACSHSSIARMTWLVLESLYIFKMENFMRNMYIAI